MSNQTVLVENHSLSALLRIATEGEAKAREQTQQNQDRTACWYQVEDAWKAWRQQSAQLATALGDGNRPDIEVANYANAVLKFRQVISESPWSNLWAFIPDDDARFHGAADLLRDCTKEEIQNFLLHFQGQSLGSRAFEQDVGMFPQRIWTLFERCVSNFDLERVGLAAVDFASRVPANTQDATDQSPTHLDEKEEGEKLAGVNVTRKVGGRPKLTDSKNPMDQAKRNVYELVRAVKNANPKFGEKQLLQHFKNEKDFKQRVKDAELVYGEGMFRAALVWLKENSVAQETRAENVS